jgi:hypothetical protein
VPADKLKVSVGSFSSTLSDFTVRKEPELNQRLKPVADSKNQSDPFFEQHMNGVFKLPGF